MWRVARLIENMPTICQQTARMVEEWGGEAYLVGGPVRHLLISPNDYDISAVPDWDIVVDLRPTGRGLARLLKEMQVLTGSHYVFYQQFLTGTLVLGDVRVDIAHTRDETYPAPAVLPVVRPAGIEADLRRRDFTINAIAVRLTGRDRGTLVDPTGGQADIEAQVVRIIHPNSFVDDPTRIFRCIRYAVRHGFEIESGTLYLLRRAVKDRYPARLTPERILYELRCICREPAALKMLEAVIKEGVLASCWSQLPGADFFGYPVERLLADLQALSQAKAAPELMFIYLLSRLPVDERFPIVRLEREAQQALREADVIVSRLRHAQRRSTIYEVLRGVPVSALEILAILEPEPIRRRIKLYFDRLIGVEPELRAADLIAAGVKPGPALGWILKRLHQARLDGKVKSLAEEKELVRRLTGRNV